MVTSPTPDPGVALNAITIRRTRLGPAETATARALRASGEPWHIVAAMLGVSPWALHGMTSPPPRRRPRHPSRRSREPGQAEFPL